jgi:Flp pilus assembly protein TadG
MSSRLGPARWLRVVARGTIRARGRFSTFRRLIACDQSGSVILEFAFTMPIFVLLALTALELVNLALAHMTASQVAMSVADNLSRAKTSVPLGLPRLREVDINDTMIGAGSQGSAGFNLLTNGRIVVSSLQRNSSGRQVIAWQRCKGRLAVASQYGVQGATQPSTGTAGFQGMGRASDRVQAEPNSAIIFAEVTYDYQPMIGEWLLGSFRMRKEAAFYVRDDRDLVGGTAANGMYNPSPSATVSACNVFNDTF